MIWIDPKVSNFASGDSIIDYELVGEYSDYFRIGYFYGSYNGNYYQHFCVSVSEYGLGKLRAGQTYKLAVEYTIRTENGDTYTVTSNTFTVKPKQSKPKITVSGNNQTLFAAADNVSRSYTISLPNYYTISSAYGALDCNKDGVADIYVGLSSTSGSYGNRGQLTVRIIDRDGVVATAKGKSYTIPVTVQVQGRDGVTKDATVSLKVTVKR